MWWLVDAMAVAHRGHIRIITWEGRHRTWKGAGRSGRGAAGRPSVNLREPVATSQSLTSLTRIWPTKFLPRIEIELLAVPTPAVASDLPSGENASVPGAVALLASPASVQYSNSPEGRLQSVKHSLLFPSTKAVP